MEENNEQTQVKTKEENGFIAKGFGIASMVLAILSLMFFKFIFICVTLALVACILGLIGKHKGNNTFAIAGLTIGIISLLITFVLFVLLNLLDTVLFYVPDWYK